MPRAGAGGSSHSSGGHHSSSHSSGGHHVSGGHSGSGGHSRAGGGSRPSGGGFGGGPRHGGGGFGGGPRPTPPPPPPRHHHHHRWGPTPPPRRSFGCSGVIGSIIILFIVLTLLSMSAASCSANAITGMFSSKKTTVVSYTNREKLSNSGAFNSDCIVDELYWFDDTKSAGNSLKTFYDKTGVQPYVVLLAYDASLTSDAAKEDYANDYYNKHIDDENSFLFIYFAEKDQDNEVGYMCYVCGDNARSVMDSEAVDIFWEFIDQYWYDDISTDDLFETVFTKTAKTIMDGSSTASSGFGKVVRNVLIIVVVVILAVVIIKKISKKETNSKPTDSNPNILN